MILFCFKAIVSFGKVNPEQKEKVEQNGVSIYSWEEFLQLVRFLFIDLARSRYVF